MRVLAGLIALLAVAAPLDAAMAQTAVSPFAGHWVGNEHCSYGDGKIDLTIEQSPDGGLSTSMVAAGIGTLHDATFSADTITLTWTNFISHVTFVGKFVSPERVEGTYHESITGEDCTWFAVNQTPALGMAALPAPESQSPPSQSAPQPQAASAAPQPQVASVAPLAPTQLDLWKQHADADRKKLDAHVGPQSKDAAVGQFCAFAPDREACAARIANAFDFLMKNAFATLTIASKNKAVSLPAMEPAAGLPSYYDVYQIYMFLTRDASP